MNLRFGFLATLLVLTPLGAFASDASRSPRESITFLLGSDENPLQPMFCLAEAYFREDATERTDHVVPTCKSLVEVRNGLVEKAPRTGQPWGIVNLVVHGDPLGRIGTPLFPDGSPIDPDALQKAFATHRFEPLPDTLVDEGTEIRIHGCSIGKNPQLLHALSRILGGEDPHRPVVRASPYFSCFQRQDGKVVRFLSESWSLNFLPGERPSAEALATTFHRRFPKAGINPKEALSFLSAKRSGDVFSLESHSSYTWKVRFQGGGAPALRTRGELLAWLRAQNDLQHSLRAASLEFSRMHWEVALMGEDLEGFGNSVVRFLGLGRVVHLFRALESPGIGEKGSTRLDWGDARYFVSAR